MHRKFTPSLEHTIGVEIELGMISRSSLELSNSINVILDNCPDGWDNSNKPEFMQSYCEFNTGICNTVEEVRTDLSEKLKWGYETAAEQDLTFLWSGTHPTSQWRDQELSPGERYEWLNEYDAVRCEEACRIRTARPHRGGQRRQGNPDVRSSPATPSDAHGAVLELTPLVRGELGTALLSFQVDGITPDRRHA